MAYYTQKINLEPVPQGFQKVEGKNVEEIIKELEHLDISRCLCFPERLEQGVLRRHTIIICRDDFTRLMVQKIFGEVDNRGPSYCDMGLWGDAIYTNGTLIMTEETLLRFCNPTYSPFDGDFLDVNKIRLADAMRPYQPK